MKVMELEQVVRNIDGRLTKVEQILPSLATKDDLKAHPTHDDLARGLLELRAELRTQFMALAERIHDSVRLVAEGHIDLQRQHDEAHRRFKARMDEIDRRVLRVEARR